MAKINQFGGVPGASPGVGRDCLPFEAMLADAIDGTLSASDQARFEEHLATCEKCPGMLADAQRGQALLEMLRPEVLEPSSTLLERILDQTTGQRARDEEAARAQRRAANEAASLLGTSSSPAAVAVVRPVAADVPAAPGKVLPFRTRLQTRLLGVRHVVLQPRFAMTAAMAFFSIALTLNLSGVRVGQLRLSDLKASNVKRGVYEARARVVRYYANLRVVYELESRVHDLGRSDDDHSNTAPETAAPQNAQPVGTDSAAPEDKKNGNSTTPAAPRPGKSENPPPAAPQGGAAEPPKNSRNRPNAGTSRCNWPLPAIQEVDFVGPAPGRHTFFRAVSAVKLPEPSELHGKRGLV